MSIDKPKSGFDSLASAVLVTITTTLIHSHHKSSMQKNINQGGARHTVTNHHNSHANAFTNQTKMMTSSLHHPFAVATAAHHAILSISSAIPVVGTIYLRNATNISGAPSRLTIFYNSLMFLRKRGLCFWLGMQPPLQLQLKSTPKPFILESFVVNHPAAISQSVGVGWSGAITDMTASKQGTILVSPNKAEPMTLVTSSTFLPST